MISFSKKGIPQKIESMISFSKNGIPKIQLCMSEVFFDKIPQSVPGD